MSSAAQPPFANRSSPLSMSSEPRHSVPWSFRYLQIYNLLSSLAWAIVLGRVVLLVPLVGFEHVHGGAGTWLRWTQTTAGLEVLHALTGQFLSSSSSSSSSSSQSNSLPHNETANRGVVARRIDMCRPRSLFPRHDGHTGSVAVLARVVHRPSFP